MQHVSFLLVVFFVLGQELRIMRLCMLVCL